MSEQRERMRVEWERLRRYEVMIAVFCLGPMPTPAEVLALYLGGQDALEDDLGAPAAFDEAWTGDVVMVSGTR